MKRKKQNKTVSDLKWLELTEEDLKPLVLNKEDLKIIELSEKDLKEMEISIDLNDCIIPFDIESIKPMTKEEIEELEKELAKGLEKSEKELKELLKNPTLYDIDEFIKETPILDLEFEK